MFWGLSLFAPMFSSYLPTFSSARLLIYRTRIDTDPPASLAAVCHARRKRARYTQIPFSLRRGRHKHFSLSVFIWVNPCPIFYFPFSGSDFIKLTIASFQISPMEYRGFNFRKVEISSHRQRFKFMPCKRIFVDNNLFGLQNIHLQRQIGRV